jgi:phage terminase large subunit
MLTRSLDIRTARVFEPLLAPARYKGAHGGRGSGKSHFFCESLVDRCMVPPGMPGVRAVCLREVQKSLEQSVKRLVEDKIIEHKLGRHFRVLNSHIETPGNGIIIFQGLQNHTAESIKSLEGYDIALVEEAQSLSQRSLDLLRPTLRKDGSEMWFAWNPKSEKDPVDKFLRAEKPEGAVVVEANWRQNPWFPAVLRADKEYDKRRDPERYSHVWLGKYQRNSEARVFHNWKVEEFETPPDARFYFGADFGFAVDPTVLVRMFIVGRKLFIDYESWKVGCEIDHTPALFDKVPGARKWPIIADSANPQSISYLARNGFPAIRPSVKGTGSVEEGVEFLKSFDIVVHPHCPHVADELASYSYEIDRQTEEVLPRLADAKNHTIDAARYAVEAVRNAPAQPAFGSYGR